MRRTHGHSFAIDKRQSRTYMVWSAMIQRCHNSGHKDFKYYGGRGVTVCDEWRQSFEAFLKDMGEKSDGMMIERIDNAKGYGPANCRWATRQEQARNRRNNHIIEIDGVSKTLIEWCECCGINRYKVKDRLNICGWTPKQALELEPAPKNNPWVKRRQNMLKAAGAIA